MSQGEEDTRVILREPLSERRPEMVGLSHSYEVLVAIHGLALVHLGMSRSELTERGIRLSDRWVS